jgi:hypothetical protein
MGNILVVLVPNVLPLVTMRSRLLRKKNTKLYKTESCAWRCHQSARTLRGKRYSKSKGSNEGQDIMKGDGASVPVLPALEVDFVLNQEDLDKYEGGEGAEHSDK